MAKYYALTLTVLLIGIHLTLSAQREIKGHAYDKDTRKPLPAANVLLYTAERSVLIAQGITNDAGDFVLKKIPVGNYRLTISFMGYDAATTLVIISERSGKVFQLDLRNSGLQRNPIKLNSINVKVNKSAFAIRKDTVEFSAGDFQTAENASLRSLLNKLPGITIDAEGNLSFQGTAIKTILVNGRPLFQDASGSSGSTKKITQTLLADIVDKIQVIDRKRVDGLIEGGKDEKVINITVKKEYKKGINGTAGAGYATGKRYSAAASANMFRDTKQAMVMGYINNINSSRGPSSTDENLSRAEAMMGGISHRNNLSANLATDISKKIKLNANFVHQGHNTDNHQWQQRDNILPDSNFRYNNNNTSTSTANLNIMFANMTIQPDEKNFISVDMSVNRQANTYNALNKYISTGGKSNDTINFGNTSNREKRRNSNFNITTQYNHQFSPKAGSVSLSLNVEQNNSKSDQNNITLNTVAAANLADTLNQQVNMKINVRKLMARANYQYPLFPSIYLNVSYKITNNQTKNNQDAFDFDNEKKGYDIINNDLSYRFKNEITEQSIGTGIFLNKTKIQGQLNIAYNITDSKSNNFTNGNNFLQKINYLSPNLSFSYKIDNYKSLDLRINRETRIPPPSVYLPVVSTRNPLYVQLGNPDLKPSIYNSASLGYRSFSVTGITFSTSIGGDLPNNAISQSVYSDSAGRQISKPVNTEGNFNINQDFSIGKRFNKPAVTVNYSLSYYFNRSNSFINQEKNRTSDLTVTQMLNSSWMYKKVLELEGFVSMLYISSVYAIQDNKHSDYLMYNVSLSANAFLPADISIGSAVLYFNNTSQHQQFVVLNSWVAKTFGKNKSFQAKLYAYDLTRQNQSLFTMQSPTYIEQQRNAVLTQYYMLSLSYFFGKKSKL
ncbi:outer membrane beta-barrel protein [Chitinophaga polysaccharea]|uniref:outer membrane beta-barrel protein n=1 Tax=Chitinophaga polysaccharea TaxID=1293035 RepID=UPI00163B7633|nr:outer membrane beta-barrel protein [Chitinophaga polysaccharea]